MSICTEIVEESRQNCNRKVEFKNYYIVDEEFARISGFCRATEIDFQSLAGPRSVGVDLKYDVLCL